MNVVVTIAALNPVHGGPSRTVPALCRALARNGVKVTLLTISKGESNVADMAAGKFEFKIIRMRTSRYNPGHWKSAFRRTLRQISRRGSPTILYDVGLWLPSNHLVATFARKTGTPLVASPRGMLSTRALQISKWKKRLAWQLYQKRDLRAARVLHATSDAEASDLRRRGLDQPIAVIPNGVELPPREDAASPRSNGIRTALFLSRLHPIKGLADLIKAWARVRPPGWQVVIAGPNENGYRAETERLVDKLNLTEQIHFIGPVDDCQKWALYRSAELFILPSHSESFGQVIGEALAAGIPVITTRATPWSMVEGLACGWYVNPGIEPLVWALKEASSRPVEELQQMGVRGRQLIEEHFSWATVGKKMIQLFTWLVGDGPKPESVV